MIRAFGAATPLTDGSLFFIQRVIGYGGYGLPDITS
jgi:hypothetical protein